MEAFICFLKNFLRNAKAHYLCTDGRGDFLKLLIPGSFNKILLSFTLPLVPSRQGRGEGLLQLAQLICFF